MKRWWSVLLSARATVRTKADALRRRRDLGLYMLFALVISAITSALFTQVALFKQLELGILDLRFKWRPPIQVLPQLGTVDIDSATIERVGGWPIPRSVYADSIRVLHAYDASLVTFDIFFPDPTAVTLSREQMDKAIKMVGGGTGSGGLSQYLEHLASNPDEDFAAALAEANLVVMAQSFLCAKPVRIPDVNRIKSLTEAELDRKSERQLESLSMANAFSIPHQESPGKSRDLARAYTFEAPDPALLRHAVGLGFAQIVQDLDGTTRKYPLFILYNGRLYPSVGMMGISKLTGVPLADVTITPGKHVILPGARWQDDAGRERVADIKIPVDRYLQMMVNWTGDYLDTFIHIPASLLLRFHAEDLIRRQLHTYRDKQTKELIEDGVPLAIQMVVERRLLDEDEAKLLASRLMLAQMAETALAGKNASRDRFVGGYDDPDDRKTVSDVWDQVAANRAILDILKKAPATPYAEIKKTVGRDDACEAEQRHAAEFLRFLVTHGKDIEQWRPLYFFPPVDVSYVGSPRKTAVSPIDLAGKIFYVGLTAPGTHDHGPMPFNNGYPMVGLHANALNTVLTGQFLREPPIWCDILVTGVLALLIAYLASRLHPAAGAGSVVLMACACLWLAGMAFNRFGIWLPSMQLAVAIAVTYLAVVVHSVIQERREKAQLRTAFSTYVPPSIVRRVMEDPAMLHLGGQRRVMTVFFSDVAGFTAISERSTPEELVAHFNEYLEAMTRVIFQHDGTLDKYQGDGVMAFWNAPVDQADHAYRACCAALDSLACLRTELYPKWQAAGRPPLPARIGVNTGFMLVGNMGSKTRMNYTVMGDAVNVGSRVESANKDFGTQAMASEYTVAEVRDRIAVRELDIIRVVGREKPVRVFELMARREDLDQVTGNLLDAYHVGLAHYRARRWQEAMDAFAVALTVRGDDGPSQVYLERCRKHQAEPPRPDWDGVWVLKEK